MMNKTKELFKWPMLLIGMCCAIILLVGWLTLLNISASLNHNYVLKDSGVTKNLTIEYKEVQVKNITKTAFVFTTDVAKAHQYYGAKDEK